MKFGNTSKKPFQKTQHKDCRARTRTRNLIIPKPFLPLDHNATINSCNKSYNNVVKRSFSHVRVLLSLTGLTILGIHHRSRGAIQISAGRPFPELSPSWELLSVEKIHLFKVAARARASRPDHLYHLHISEHGRGSAHTHQVDTPREAGSYFVL